MPLPNSNSLDSCQVSLTIIDLIIRLSSGKQNLTHCGSLLTPWPFHWVTWSDSRDQIGILSSAQWWTFYLFQTSRSWSYIHFAFWQEAICLWIALFEVRWCVGLFSLWSQMPASLQFLVKSALILLEWRWAVDSHGPKGRSSLVCECRVVDWT